MNDLKKIAKPLNWIEKKWIHKYTVVVTAVVNWIL